MRVGTIAAITICLGGGSTAIAADAPAGGPVVGNGVSAPYVARIEPLIVYDYEPGVIVRSYWLPPWQGRHYFPRTGKRPKVGRHEHKMPARKSMAEDYFRSWSVSSVFAPDLPPPPMLPYAIGQAPSLGQPK